jgi:hypothetical protein
MILLQPAPCFIAPILKFKPSLLIDYSLQNTRKLTQFDINGNFIMDLIWAGGSWRISEQVQWLFCRYSSIIS